MEPELENKNNNYHMPTATFNQLRSMTNDEEMLATTSNLNSLRKLFSWRADRNGNVYEYYHIQTTMLEVDRRGNCGNNERSTDGFPKEIEDSK